MQEYEAQPGDVFACFGRDLVARFISLQTFSALAPARLRVGPSHVAIASQVVGLRDAGVCWVESTMLSRVRCLVRGARVAGCQVHRIADRVSEYLNFGGCVDVYRLTPINCLSESDAAELARNLSWFVSQGIGYDAASAVFSGTHFVSLLDRVLGLWSANPQAVFCSQLLAAELQTFGLMCRDNPQRYSPGRLVRQLVRQGVYSRFGSLEVNSNAPGVVSLVTP